MARKGVGCRTGEAFQIEMKTSHSAWWIDVFAFKSVGTFDDYWH
jgi:hypothetical protein